VDHGTSAPEAAPAPALASHRARRTPKVPASEWAAWDDERLLDLRLCDLDVRIEGSGLEDRIAELYRDLEARGLGFRPHFWLSDEWFCPDGVPGIAIPFYLAHPRLARLELNQMLEVEGGTREWCLKILRHETGHAIENAYNLRRRPLRQRLFGRTSEPYPEYYSPKPYSKSFVIHLEGWYAQSHPDEDFAETFAVWLNPGSDWAARYAGWPALRKLEYMEKVMRAVGPIPLPVRSRRTPDALSSLRRTLRKHYHRKRQHYGVDHPDSYDRDLRRIFSESPDPTGHPPAAAFLSRIRREVRRRVQRWTGEYQSVIDRMLLDMIDRSRELKLRLASSEDEAKLDFTSLVTAQAMTRLHRRRHRVPL
jgi:hypothetical protein